MSKLSIRQQKIVDFIRRFRTDRHYPPTVRDIVDGCRISSTSVVAYNLHRLEEMGLVRRHSGISRGIELLDGLVGEGTRKIPLIGQIAAGVPIPVPAVDTWDPSASAETVEVTEEMLLGKEAIYALRVKGTSMVDALINDGDLVLMQYTNSVENGETAAVWFKAEKEATLKKVYRERDRIRLQPANSLMGPIYADPDNVEIQGKVLGVIRMVA